MLWVMQVLSVSVCHGWAGWCPSYFTRRFSWRLHQLAQSCNDMPHLQSAAWQLVRQSELVSTTCVQKRYQLDVVQRLNCISRLSTKHWMLPMMRVDSWMVRRVTMARRQFQCRYY